MKDFTRRGFIFGVAGIASYGLLVGVQRICLSAFADDEPDNSSSAVKIVKFADDGTRIGVVGVPKLRKTKDQWKKQLSPGQFEVTRRAATEFAFSGALYREERRGICRCIDCGNALFSSAAKFDSDTGWPSFWQPIADENLYERVDASFGVIRREVKCTLCDAHLGHVFPDGPQPTGLRYCMNSAALRFVPSA